MKTINNIALSAVSLSLLLFSCKPEIDVPAPQKGSVDATTYVAIGNSLTAGYSDNALYNEAQLVSYPNLLAQQLKLIGGGAFKQPLVNESSVGIGSALNARMRLGASTDCAGVTSLAPTFAAQMGDLNIFTTSVAPQGPFNNMGIPGLKSVTALYPGYGDYTQGTGNYNPFYTRMTANPQTGSVLGEAVAQNPTFFSLAIGTDDVMGYALSGGTADAITPSGGPIGGGFDASVEYMVTALTGNGAKGVIASIPDVVSMPFFTTIPFNGLQLDAANAAGLTAAYAQLGITFQEGYNGFVIEDANVPGGMRKMQSGELLLLSVPQDSLKCAGWGSMKPIPNQFVLTTGELTLVEEATTAYNAKLKDLATAKGLAFVDVNAFMRNANTGILYNGIAMNAKFVSGGIFSLDGVHMTPIGNALLANEFIKSINMKYGSTIPQVNAGKYKGVRFP